MGMCKGCGKVFNVTEMKNGYCKSCSHLDTTQEIHIDKELKPEEVNEIKINKKMEFKEVESNQRIPSDNMSQVVISDIKIPFTSILEFTMKTAIAMVPALIVFYMVFIILLAITFWFMGGGDLIKELYAINHPQINY